MFPFLSDSFRLSGSFKSVETFAGACGVAPGLNICCSRACSNAMALVLGWPLSRATPHLENNNAQGYVRVQGIAAFLCQSHPNSVGFYTLCAPPWPPWPPGIVFCGSRAPFYRILFASVAFTWELLKTKVEARHPQRTSPGLQRSLYADLDHERAAAQPPADPCATNMAMASRWITRNREPAQPQQQQRPRLPPRRH